MKAIQSYSINVVVLENFNEIVPSQQRSKVIEALLIEFMIQKEGEDFPSTIPSLTTEKDMIT